MSLFLNMYNLTVKQHNNHGAIKKECHLRSGIFHPINLSHTFSILLFHLFCVFTKMNYGMREKKIFCIYGCFSVSGFIKGGRKSSPCPPQCLRPSLLMQMNSTTYQRRIQNSDKHLRKIFFRK